MFFMGSYSYYFTLYSVHTRVQIEYIVTYGTHMINTYVFRLSRPRVETPCSPRPNVLLPCPFYIPIFSSLLSTRFHVASQRAMTNSRSSHRIRLVLHLLCTFLPWRMHETRHIARLHKVQELAPPSIPLLTLYNSAWWGEVAWQVPREEHRINQTSVIYCFVQPCRIVQYLYTPSNTSTKLSI